MNTDNTAEKTVRQMDYATYFDKVYGCWLGKCICGSIGAPLEGCKQLFDYAFDPAFWLITEPNDDLELQILWLNVLETIGLDFDADDLAQAFLAEVPTIPANTLTSSATSAAASIRRPREPTTITSIMKAWAAASGRKSGRVSLPEIRNWPGASAAGTGRSTTRRNRSIPKPSSLRWRPRLLRRATSTG